MSSTYDVIVLGTGGVGSAALFELANRGLRVVGVDRFAGGHNRGSSHGHTRVIRQAYFEHPHYVPLVLRAYELWHRLEERIGWKLYHEVGLLEAGPEDGILIPGILDSTHEHGLEVETVTERDVRDRFPGYRIPDGGRAVYERRAGYLMAEQSVLAHLDQASQLGAQLWHGHTVRGWCVENGEVRVDTSGGVLRAARLIITAGAWAPQLLNTLGISLRVVRKHLHWYENHDPSYHVDAACPIFFFEVPEGLFYGFPHIDDRGVKLAEHSGGEPVVDPLHMDRRIDPADIRRVEDFLRSYLPGVSAKRTDHVVCMYTKSSDDHFILDFHPSHPQVCFAAGLSGHGFKFTPVLAEALVDLAVEGQTRLPVGFLALSRLYD